MAIRGELFTNQVNLDKRSYFFNVKENRNGDVFLQIVESKIKDGQEIERRDIVVFADDLQSFLKGMDVSLGAIDKIEKERSRQRFVKKLAQDAKYGARALSDSRDCRAPGARGGEKVYRRKGENRLVSDRKAGKKDFPGRLHVVSKRPTDEPAPAQPDASSNTES